MAEDIHNRHSFMAAVFMNHVLSQWIARFLKRRHLIALFPKSMEQLSLNCDGNEVYAIWIVANVQTNHQIRYANTFYQLFAEKKLPPTHTFSCASSRLEFCFSILLHFHSNHI